MASESHRRCGGVGGVAGWATSRDSSGWSWDSPSATASLLSAIPSHVPSIILARSTLYLENKLKYRVNKARFRHFNNYKRTFHYLGLHLGQKDSKYIQEINYKALQIKILILVFNSLLDTKNSTDLSEAFCTCCMVCLGDILMEVQAISHSGDIVLYGEELMVKAVHFVQTRAGLEFNWSLKLGMQHAK